MITADQRRDWQERGFFIVRGFAPKSVCDAMLARAIEIARRSAKGWSCGTALVTPEAKPNPAARNPEDLVSKIFRLHRDTIFHDFCTDERVIDLIGALLGDDLDCFLSQFIFKNAGAMGQPWHQDSYYFPFDKSPQVGIWLAITQATPENGCLHVLPGSHREPIHTHIPDRRPHANYGYLEIVDHDTSESTPVLMEPGDLLVFHSHLMHRSTDNASKGIRAAMVWHYTAAGTVDSSADKFGRPSVVNDFMAVSRST